MERKMLHVDTLKIARKIEASGLTREQADAIASSLHEVDTSNLATKEDIFAVRSDFEALRGEMRSDLAAETSKLRVEIAAVRTELTKQIYLVQAAAVGIILAAFRLMA